MKALYTSFFTLLINVSFSQQVYTFPNHHNLNVIDVAGDNFAITYSNDTHIFVKEYTSDMNLVWHDSLEIPYPNIDIRVTFYGKEKFNEDEYVVFYNKWITPNVSPPNHNAKIALIAVKFSSSGQAIVNSKAIEVENSVYGIPKFMDSVIVLNFYKQYPSGNPNGDYRGKVFYKLDSDLNHEIYPYSDTIEAYSANIRSSVAIDDTIVQILAWDGGGIKIEKYTNECTFVSVDTKTFPTYNATFTSLPNLIYLNNNPDSLLYVTSLTYNGNTSINKIVFKLFDRNFNTLKESIVAMPNSNQGTLASVMVLADTIYLSTSANNKISNYKYDLGFNELCLFPQTFPTDHYETYNYSLLSINGLPYLSKRYMDQTYHPLNECSEVSLDKEIPLSFSVSPNPFNNEIVVDLSGNSEFNLSVYDLKGGLIKDYGNHFGKTKLFTDELEKGLYFLRIENVSNLSVIKILKQ